MSRGGPPWHAIRITEVGARRLSRVDGRSTGDDPRGACLELSGLRAADAVARAWGVELQGVPPHLAWRIEDEHAWTEEEKSMTKTTVVTLISLLALGSWSGCAMGQKKVEKELANPAQINCATADGDLRLLQHEKANVAERMAEGVMAVYPAGLVVGLVTRTEGTKLKVATGEYNKMIDARMAEIKQTCGIQ